MEASLAGLPVVTTRVGGIPELIQDGETGWCVECEPASIAKAVEEILADYRRALELAHGARRVVLDQHDLDNNVRLLVAAWDSALTRGSPESVQKNHLAG